MHCAPLTLPKEPVFSFVLGLTALGHCLRDSGERSCVRYGSVRVTLSYAGRLQSSESGRMSLYADDWQ